MQTTGQYEILKHKVIRSDDYFLPEDRPANFEKSDTVGLWQVRVQFGSVPQEVIRDVAVFDLGRNIILDHQFSGTPATRAECDEKIEQEVNAYQLGAQWLESNRLYTTITTRRPISDREIPEDLGTQHWWVLPDTGKQLLEKYNSEAERVIGLVVARLLHGATYHATGKVLDGAAGLYLVSPNRNAAPISMLRMTAEGEVGRGSWEDVTDRLKNQSVTPVDGKKDCTKTVGEIGRWLLLALNEKDDFRRFMWSYSGLEYLLTQVASTGRDDVADVLTNAFEPGNDPGVTSSVTHELLWPSNTLEQDPNRAVRFRMAASALLLSSSTASDDVETFKRLNLYRNGIHGSLGDHTAAPSAEAFALFSKYARLATSFLSNELP